VARGNLPGAGHTMPTNGDERPACYLRSAEFRNDSTQLREPRRAAPLVPIGIVTGFVASPTHVVELGIGDGN